MFILVMPSAYDQHGSCCKNRNGPSFPLVGIIIILMMSANVEEKGGNNDGLNFCDKFKGGLLYVRMWQGEKNDGDFSGSLPNFQRSK